jgi:hypothetical protein
VLQMDNTANAVKTCKMFLEKQAQMI